MLSSCLSQCRVHPRENVNHDSLNIHKVHMGQRAQMTIDFYALILHLSAHGGSDVERWSRFRWAIERMAEETDCMNLG